LTGDAPLTLIGATLSRICAVIARFSLHRACAGRVARVSATGGVSPRDWFCRHLLCLGITKREKSVTRRGPTWPPLAATLPAQARWREKNRVNLAPTPLTLPSPHRGEGKSLPQKAGESPKP